MSLVEKPESKELGAQPSNGWQLLRVLRDWRSVHTGTTEKLRALGVKGFDQRRARRESAEHANRATEARIFMKTQQVGENEGVCDGRDENTTIENNGLAGCFIGAMEARKKDGKMKGLPVMLLKIGKIWI
jgi:hypothetical protein